MEAVEAGSVYVHTDVTAVFPWLTHALLSDRKMRRKPKRLYDSLEAARKLYSEPIADQIRQGVLAIRPGSAALVRSRPPARTFEDLLEQRRHEVFVVGHGVIPRT